MEQVNAPARAYHQQMRRELPVTSCTECGGAGYNMRVANGRCCKTSGERRCSGINAIAIKAFDWSECTHCKQPDITAIKNARTAKVPAIYSWAGGIKQRFRRALFALCPALSVLID